MKLQELNKSELTQISGGSEASDNFMHSMGQLAGHIYNGISAVGSALGSAMTAYGNAYQAHLDAGGSHADWKN